MIAGVIDITATSTVQFEKGVTFDQIGTIKLTAMNLNINGIVKVQRLTGSIAANISVAVGASLTCEDLDVGANGKSVDFINEGFITTTKSLRLKNIRLLNRATARIQTAHNLIGAELGVKGISNDGTIEVGGDVKLHNVPYEASKTSGTLTASKTVDLQFIQTPSSLGSIKADVISIKVSIGVARGGFSARQITIEASLIHIETPTQASERISFTTPTLNVSAAVSTPTLSVSSKNAAGKVTVDKTGSITTRANISWNNIQRLKNDGEIKTQQDIVLSNIQEIIQNGTLASAGNVTISGKSTSLIFEMSTEKYMQGKQVTIDCNVVTDICVLADTLSITALDTLGVRTIESRGEITLSATNKISVGILKASNAITFGAAKLISIGTSVEADGDIVIPEGGELDLTSFNGAKISSGRSIVIKRKLKPGKVRAEMSAYNVQWILDGLSAAEQENFFYDGYFYLLKELTVTAVNVFRLIVPHPVNMSVLPNFLKDSNLEFRTSGFVASFDEEFPHSLHINGLTTSEFNDGKKLMVEGKLIVTSDVLQNITGIVDTGKGWKFSYAFYVKPGARLTAMSGYCKTNRLLIDQGEVLASNLTVTNDISVDEGHLVVSGNLSADSLSNVYRGNSRNTPWLNFCRFYMSTRTDVSRSVNEDSEQFDRASYIKVSGNATIAGSLRNEWLSPSNKWHNDEATLIVVGGNLVVGTAGNRRATFTNKCGRVYVNGQIVFNGQKFENLIRFIEHRGLSAHLFVMGEYFYDNPHLLQGASIRITPSMYYFQCDPRLKKLVTLAPGKELATSSTRKKASEVEGGLNALTDAVNTLGFGAVGLLMSHPITSDEYSIHENNLGRYLSSTGLNSEFSLNIPGRYQWVWKRVSGFFHKGIHYRYTIDYDEPIHKTQTTVVGRGGISVNGTTIRDGAADTSSFVNQGMLSSSADVRVGAHNIKSEVSTGRETPLAAAKGAVTLRPNGLKVDLPAYASPQVSTALAKDAGIRVSFVASFAAQVIVKPGQKTSKVVELDDLGQEIDVPDITPSDIPQLSDEGVFVGLLGIAPNALDVCLNLGVDPIAQSILRKLSAKVVGVLDSNQAFEVNAMISPVLGFKLFQQLIMSCSVAILKQDDFDEVEAYLKACGQIAMYLNQYGNLAGLPSDLKRYIAFEPTRHAAAEGAARLKAKAPASNQQQKAFITAVKSTLTDASASTYGIGITDEEAETVANTLKSAVVVFQPVKQTVGDTKYYPQLFLPRTYIRPFTTPAAAIQAHDMHLTSSDISRYHGKFEADHNLHFTATSYLVLAGEFTAEENAYFTVEEGNCDIGPYWDSQQWRSTVIGGKKLTVIIAKRGYCDIYPDTIFKGLEILIQCWARLLVSPKVDITWHTKYEDCGLFNWGTKRTDYQKEHYTDLVKLENPNAELTLSSMNDDVDVRGAHFYTVDGQVHQGAKVIFAHKHILLDVLLTELRSHARSSFLGITYMSEDARYQAVRTTRLASLPNLATLEEVLSNPKVMEALLAEMLGVATKAHKEVLATDPGILKLKKSKVFMQANGKVKGSAAELSAAFIDIVSGEETELKEAVSESHVHTYGWGLDFGTLGNAAMNLIDAVSELYKDLNRAQCNDEISAEAAAHRLVETNLPVLFPIMLEVIKQSLMSAAIEIASTMSEAEIHSLMKAVEILERSDYKAYKVPEREDKGDEGRGPWKMFGERAWKAVEGIVRPFAAACTANMTEVVGAFGRMVIKARKTEEENKDQMKRTPEHTYAMMETLEDSLNVMFITFKVTLMLEEMNKAGGWAQYVAKMNPLSEDNIEKGIGIGFRIYSEYIDRKTPIKGSIQALFGLKMKASRLLISGSQTKALVGDWNADEIRVGAVAHHERRRETSFGASVNMKLHASVHGGWSADTKVTFEPVTYRFQVLRIPHTRVLYIFGGCIIADIGIGEIDKVVYVHQGDTHAQDGSSFGLTVDLKAVAETFAGNTGAALAIVKDVTVGSRSGSMLVVRGGKAVFRAPGMVVHDVEEINLKEYDRRMSRTTTVYNPISLEGEASASGDLLSTHSMYGERESGFSIPNSALGQANLDRANAYSREIQRKRDERKFVDPTDITDYSQPYVPDAPEAEEPAAAPATAQPAGREEEAKKAQDQVLKEVAETLYPEPKSLSELLLEAAAKHEIELSGGEEASGIIKTIDGMLADGAKGVSEGYEAARQRYPVAVELFENGLSAFMTYAYIMSLRTVPGAIVASSLEGLHQLGVDTWLKEKFCTWLKSQGFERSGEGMSLALVGLMEARFSGKVMKGAANSKALNGLLDKAQGQFKTAMERVQNNPMLMKHYKYHMEKITELKLHPAQTEKLKEVLRTTKFEKLGKEEYKLHVKEFNDTRAQMIREWETHTGKKWPTYKTEIIVNGVKKTVDKKYDAHHIIQKNHGGPNEWWNIHPTLPKEHSQIHGSGAPAREIFVGPKKGSQ